MYATQNDPVIAIKLTHSSTKMAPTENQVLLQQLAEANDLADAYCVDIEELEAKLSAAEDNVKARELEIEDYEIMLDRAGVQFDEKTERCDELEEQLTIAEEFHEDEMSSLRTEHEQALSDLRREHEAAITTLRQERLTQSDKTASAERTNHEEAMSSLRAEHQRALSELKQGHEAAIITLRQEQHAAEKETSTRVSTLEEDLRRAVAITKDLELQLEGSVQEIRVKSDEVSKLTKERDTARGALESAAATTSQTFDAKIKDLERAVSDTTKERDDALAELSANRDLLQGESREKEQAQGAVEEFRGRFTSIEDMIDDAINHIGCADTFTYLSKLDYISASASAVTTLQAEVQELHRQLMQEREAKQESGAVAPDVPSSGDQVVGMSADLEAELRADNQLQRAEIEGQLCTIKRQKEELESKTAEIEGQLGTIERQKKVADSKSAEAHNLQISLKRRDERIRALEEQLAREQTQATELRELQSQNALLERKLGQAEPQIARLEQNIADGVEMLRRERNEKDGAQRLLAESEKKLEEVKEQSTFRRIANKLYILRIDKDTELLANQAASVEILKGEVNTLKDQIKQKELEYRAQLLTATRSAPRPSSTPRQTESMRLQTRFVVETNLRREMRAEVREGLEAAWTEEKRKELKAEVAREFADLKKETSIVEGSISGALDDPPMMTVVRELGISPIHTSYSQVGVETPTTADSPIFLVVLLVVAATLLSTPVLSSLFPPPPRLPEN